MLLLIQITDKFAGAHRALRLLVVGALLATFAGCSAARLAYERLDLLVRWELGRYVSLTAGQRTVFDREFGAFWQWHRQEELPLWVEELRGLAAQLEPGTSVDRGQLEATSEHYGDIMRRLSEHLVPIACALGPQLDAEQVQELLEEVDDDIDELRSELVDIEPADARKALNSEIGKGLRRWIGALSAEQKQLVETWVMARPSVAGDWLDYRRRWRGELESVLARRSDPTFCDRAATLVANGASLWTEAQKQAFARNRERWLDLFDTLIPTLTAEQRRHTQQRLRELADELAAAAAAGMSQPQLSAFGAM